MNYLFPHRFKKVSGIIFYASIPLGLYWLFTDQYDSLLEVPVLNLFSADMVITTPETENILGSEGGNWIYNGILDEIMTFIVVSTGLIHGFCKENIEDELVANLRANSLKWALFINYGLLIVANFLVYEFSYFYTMVVFMFTLLLFYNLIFGFKLYNHYHTPTEG